MVEPPSRFEEIKIPLADGVHGLREVSAVLGVPRWWPTGARISAVIAHGSGSDFNDPVVEHLHRELTERRVLTLRFNFPFAEAKKTRPDSNTALRRCFRAAVGVLARDPTAAPAHLFVGGMGVGAEIAADLAAERVRVDGLFFLGYPLHPRDKPESIRSERLFRVVSPMLFLQGTRDRRCHLDALRRTLSRVGAPTSLHISQDADKDFRVLKKSGRTEEEVRNDLVGAVDVWIQKILAL